MRVAFITPTLTLVVALTPAAVVAGSLGQFPGAAQRLHQAQGNDDRSKFDLSITYPCVYVPAWRRCVPILPAGAPAPAGGLDASGIDG